MKQTFQCNFMLLRRAGAAKRDRFELEFFLERFSIWFKY